MKLTATAIEIPDDEPFRNDLLGRKKAADALTELTLSSSGPLVLCLDAPWGQGKSTFLQMWRGSLRLAGIPTVAFSAWEHDFAEDPLIALIGEIEAQFVTLETGTEKGEGSAHARLEVAKKWGLKFVKATLPTAVKIATAGVLDLKDFTEEALAELGEKVTAAKLAEYEEGRQSIAKFRTALEQFATRLGRREEADPVPLVVLIDELDRCRPTYAIQLLERLKHLFAVPGTVYVLALDREQLGHAVRSQYGEGVDADGYLRRFFDLEFRLPEPSHEAFCKAQVQRFGLVEYFASRTGSETRYDREGVESVLGGLANVLRCSLRDVERAFSMLVLAVRITPRDHYLYPELLAAVILMKLRNPDLYQNFGSGRVGADAVFKWISGFPEGTGFLEGHTGALLEAHLMACQSERFRGGDLVDRYTIPDDAHGISDAQKQRAANMVGWLRSSYFRRSVYGCLPRIIEKVDLVSSFRE